MRVCVCGRFPEIWMKRHMSSSNLPRHRVLRSSERRASAAWMLTRKCRPQSARRHLQLTFVSRQFGTDRPAQVKLRSAPTTGSGGQLCLHLPVRPRKGLGAFAAKFMHPDYEVGRYMGEVMTMGEFFEDIGQAAVTARL